jgi:hypothetical protein
MLKLITFAVLSFICGSVSADVHIQNKSLELNSNMYFESFAEGITGHLISVELDVNYTTYGLVTIENNSFDTITVPLNTGSVMTGSLLGSGGFTFSFSDNYFNSIVVGPQSTYQSMILIATDNYHDNLNTTLFTNADHLRAFNFNQITYTNDTNYIIDINNITTQGNVILTYNYMVPEGSFIILFSLGILTLLRRRI